MRTYLYRIYDRHEYLLYVGVTDDLARRMTQHRRRSVTRWRDKIHEITVTGYPDRASALAAELRAIQTEDPVYNIKGRDWTYEEHGERVDQYERWFDVRFDYELTMMSSAAPLGVAV